MNVRPTLPEVTLVSVSSVALSATVAAMKRSMEQAEFGAAMLLSHRRPPIGDGKIKWRPIRPIRSRQDYSRFMLRELAEHIDTRFALCVQWDGYVLDGARWLEEFLDHDYIGAPWPHFDDNHRVGNGGFSLRSKKLLDACTKFADPGDEAEDILIGRTYRHWLEANGIRFAPEEVARRFAFERLSPTGNEFGFHGLFNMRSILGRAGFQELVASLEPGTIGRLEAREVLGQTLVRGDLRSALYILRNRLQPKCLTRYANMD